MAVPCSLAAASSSPVGKGHRGRCVARAPCRASLQGPIDPASIHLPISPTAGLNATAPGIFGTSCPEMASPPGPSRPVAIGERAAVDEAADAHSPCASSSTTDALQPTQDTRPWQETDSRQQRCCRNLDCLSPILDGRNSTAHDPQGPTARRGSSATTTASLEGGQDDSRDSTADLEIPGMQPTQGTQSRHTVAPGPVETPTSISAANPSGWSATDSGQASLPCRTFFVMQNDGGSSRPSSSRRSQSYDTPSAVVTHSPPAPDDRRGSRPRMNRGGSPFRTGQPLEDGRARPQSRGQAVDGRSTECVLPRWQPDAEVTYCPICHAQFSIFVRKHHCRFVALSMHHFKGKVG